MAYMCVYIYLNHLEDRIWRLDVPIVVIRVRPFEYGCSSSAVDRSVRQGTTCSEP